MTALWCGFIGLFLLRLISRSGWEYVPVVLLAFGAWWHLGSQVGAYADGILFAAISGVHIVTRKDAIAER